METYHVRAHHIFHQNKEGLHGDCRNCFEDIGDMRYGLSEAIGYHRSIGPCARVTFTASS
jgi:hypothetical protein